MLLNRRAMLSASVGAIALGLSGCKASKTRIIFANLGLGPAGTTSFTVPITVNMAAGGETFFKSIAPGATAQETYRSKGGGGTAVAVTGTIKPSNAAAFNITAGLKVVIGSTNNFYVNKNNKKVSVKYS